MSGNSLDQVTSVSQFADVVPTDWAYQALANLVEDPRLRRRLPQRHLPWQPAMSYEAAALLNACLDRITEATDELRRLLKEFETELAILKGRVDGLDARVGGLDATQFSTTTKLKGQATWVFGASRFKGSSSLLRSESNGDVGGHHVQLRPSAGVGDLVHWQGSIDHRSSCWQLPR